MSREPEEIYRSPTSNGDGDIGNIKDRIKYFESGTPTVTKTKSVSFKFSNNQEYTYTKEPESEDENDNQDNIEEERTIKKNTSAIHKESENIDEILESIVKSKNLPANLKKEIKEPIKLPANFESKLNCNTNPIDSSSGIESKLDAIKQSLLNNEAEQYRDEERLKEIQRICKIRVNHSKEDAFDEIVSTEAESIISSFDFSDLNHKLNELSRDGEVSEDNFEDIKILDIDSEEKRKYGELNESDLFNKTPISFCNNDSETDTNSTYAKMVKESIRLINELKKDPESDVEFKTIRQHERSDENAKINISTSEEKYNRKSRGIIDDFINFNERPKFLQCPVLTKPKKVIISKNLYIKENVELFSREHIQQEKIHLRAPGLVMKNKPTLRLMGSVVAEDSVLYYIQVHSDNTYWYLRKRLDEFVKEETAGAAELALVKITNLSDSEFSKFILSDITERIFKRTSYVFYNRKIVLLKFIGVVLCICNKDRIEKVINIRNVKTEGDKKFIVDNEIFGCSCKTERDEWYSSILDSM